MTNIIINNPFQEREKRERERERERQTESEREIKKENGMKEIKVSMALVKRGL